jgi:signal transduction histidine kinase
MLHTTWRILCAGIAAAALVAAASWSIERARFGASDQDAVARIEGELDQRFRESADTLNRIAADVVRERIAIGSTPPAQFPLPRLFDAVDRALPANDADRTGITVYGPLDDPVAWAGRTSELPKERIERPAALLYAPGPLGPRLIRIEPVVDRSRPTPTGLGTVVVERQLGPVRGTRVADTFTMLDTLVPVSLRVRVGDVPPAVAYSFVIPSPSGGPLVDAEVSPDDLAAARTRWADRTRAGMLSIAGITLLLCAGPLLERRRRSRDTRGFVAATVGVVGAILIARVVFWFAASPLLGQRPLTSPLDLILTALAFTAMVWVTLDSIERWRLAGPRPRLLLGTAEVLAWIALAYVAAGVAVTAIVWSYELVLQDVASQTTLDLLQFSLHPLTGARIALGSGLVLLHAGVIWSAVGVTRLPGVWRTRRAFARWVEVTAWLTGVALAVGLLHSRDPSLPIAPLLAAVAAAGAGSITLSTIWRWTRHATQPARLWALFLALLVPALAMYPSLFVYTIAAKERLIATDYGQRAARQRADLQNALGRALVEIDAQRGLADLVLDSREAAVVTPNAAFSVWSATDLGTATTRLTSAVELYSASGRLVSRFTLIPEYAAISHESAGCKWEVVDEVLPLGSSQRPVLRASRGICLRGRPVGAIIVSVMLDFGTLPFIEQQSPYLESLQPAGQAPAEGAFGRDVEFVVYGWSRAPTYASRTRFWLLPDGVFQQMIRSRAPFWASIPREGAEFRVYFLNDRGEIYALGYPVITLFGHLVKFGELVFLVGVLYIALLAGAALANAITARSPASGRALLREVRASFYRKLFLAFVAATVLPVVILAVLIRTYFATQLRAGTADAAAKTALVAQRLVEDYATLPPGARALAALDDQIMAVVRRAIDEDVNLFERAQLLATSERDLFASGLLPMRTPADVYRRIVLDRLPTFVREEEGYLLAAAPVRAGGREGVVTVPVTLRREESERQIDDLDRQILSGAVLFSLLGAAVGYWMAERIADPISRLTRATRRIARGNLDARVAATDELGRLINDFNGMAGELKRQRTELERTQRLEAWADMARQVAHDIKNPLTPIQLSAEHARRVNIDHGRPLSPVLDDCINAILSQVRLLRQIATEFSSFASTATAHPAPTLLSELLDEVVGPYRSGLAGRIAIEVRVPEDLPAIRVDRNLLARAFTNVIENALHAMPGNGQLAILVRRLPSPPPGSESVVIEMTDTGIGMDPESIARLFEPYFSTKAAGTGLGLTIAKRNIELNGGTIEVHSQKGIGTTVTMTLPIGS